MYNTMTSSTNRNYIVPMFWLITKVVMIIYCWFFQAFYTGKSFWRRHFSIKYSSKDYVLGFYFFKIIGTIFSCVSACYQSVFFCLTKTFKISFYSHYTFFALSTTLMYFSTFWTFPKKTLTQFALTLWPIITLWSFVKLRDGFNFLAFRTSFCFNWFRHGLIPYIKSCLEPVSGYIPVSGLLYYSGMGMVVNKNNIILGY